MIQISKMKLLTGNILVAGVWSNSGVPAILTQLAGNETIADNVCKKWGKMVLRSKIGKFLNHRQNIMDYHGGLRTEERLKVWDSLKKNFDYLFDKSLESNCDFILRNREYLELLMPGTKSRFYDTHRRMMDEIFAFCETNNKY